LHDIGTEQNKLGVVVSRYDAPDAADSQGAKTLACALASNPANLSEKIGVPVYCRPG